LGQKFRYPTTPGKDLLALGSKRHFAAIASCPELTTFGAMSNSGFDAFGEPIVAESAAPAGGSAWLLRAGTSVFWLLVVAIVFARAVYFEPGAFSFDRAIAWAQGLFAFL
jgi:hypothetical protein